LRRIFGPKRDEVTGGWRKLHNEELHNLYSSPIRMIKPKKLRWTGHVALLVEKRHAYRIFVGKPKGKRRRWMDNIKMDLREIGWGDVDWIYLVHNRDQWRAVVNTVMNIRVP
jgi:hypothetical protein